MDVVGPRDAEPFDQEWRHALPRLPRHLVRRGRVRDALVRRAPLTVLAAPHGFGKTVALVDWLHQSFDDHEAVVWLDATREMSGAEAWGQIVRGVRAAQGCGTQPDEAPRPRTTRPTTLPPWSVTGLLPTSCPRPRR